MRCHVCRYELWNLTARACPECGTAFAPSQFTFTPDSVRYLCPHCGQDYYGTDAKGHLVPRSFECIRCARRIDMDEMTLLPAAGLSERHTRPDEVPWLSKAATWRMFRTIGWAMFQPGRLARALPPEPSPGRALFFSAIVNTIFGLLGLGVIFIFSAVMAAAAASRSGGVAAGLTVVAGIIFGLVFVVPVAFALLVCLWALLTHGLLCLFARPAGGLRRTAECLAYASGANALSGVPCLGAYVSMIMWIWWAVSGAIMLSVTHRVRGWAAALAALIPPLLVFAVAITFVALGLFGAITAAQRRVQSAQAAAQTAANVDAAARVVEMWKSIPEPAPGAPAPTPLELVGSGDLSPELLIPSAPDGTRDEHGSAAVWLRRLASVPEAEAAAMVERAMETVPDDAAAYRAGDFIIFAVPAGEWRRQPDASGVWDVMCLPATIAAMLPAPDQTLSGMDDSTMEFRVEVITATGRAESLPLVMLRAEVGLQNDLRVKLGLPEIPDPASVPSAAIPPHALEPEGVSSAP